MHGIMTKLGVVKWIWVLSLSVGGVVGCDDGGGGGGSVDVTDAGDGPGAGDGALSDGALPDGALGQVDAGSDADAETCVAGTLDCRCLADGRCRVDGLACEAGRCVDPQACDPAQTRCPPANPICYSPCRGNLLGDDGTVRNCAPDGLMEGCLSGRSCFLGTCVAATPFNAASHEEGTCDGDDAQCPISQECIQGRCYSTCEADSACDAGTQVCHMRACRDLCDRDTPCRNGFACNDGICLPSAAPSEAAPRFDNIEFSVLPRAIVASGPDDAKLTITNSSGIDIDLQIRKVRQLTVDDAGQEQLVLDSPLTWVEINTNRVDVLTVTVPANGFLAVTIGGLRTPAFARWSGSLEIGAEGLNPQTVRLSYAEGLAGRWAGTAYAFGNFGDTNLDAWRLDPTDADALDAIPNAFIQAWGRFREGRLGLPEMSALIDTTLTESWRNERVRTLCAEAGFDEDTACAPFGGQGNASVIPYSSALSRIPVPTGVIELDFAMFLRPKADCAGCFEGRIDSETALQYGGDPGILLTVAGDPLGCALGDDGPCVALFDSLSAEIVVGGRSFESQCAAGFEAITTPWLVPGLQPGAGGAVRRECRENTLPFVKRDTNARYSEANPVHDGAQRRRELELVDGLLIDQRVMFILVRETVRSFQGPPLSTYLLLVLERDSAGSNPTDAEPAPPPPEREGGVPLQPICSAGLLNKAAGPGGLNTARLVSVVLGAPGAELPDNEVVHALCTWSEDAVGMTAVDLSVGGVDTVVEQPVDQTRVVSMIDGGPDQVDCPPYAAVYFFTNPFGDMRQHKCHGVGGEACTEAVARLIGSDLEQRLTTRTSLRFPDQGAGVSRDLTYRCATGLPSCDTDRRDPRGDKIFELGGEDAPMALDTRIASAFRYKTQFVSRRGMGLGFAPEVCRDGGRLRPYCYDPAEITAIRERVDCALALATTRRDDLSAAGQARVDAFLNQNFSALDPLDEYGDPILSFGFERLYAELLIMLGDEAYAASFSARFDLAGVNAQAFEGAQFELGGPNLSGPAGFELYKLYQSTQYYDLVTERFFNMSRLLWENLDAEGDTRFVHAEVVTTWLDRVIRASTQRAAAWNEIARRYQGLDQAGLARQVIQRAYTRAWQESLILTAFMKQVLAAVGPEQLPELRRAIDQAQRRYRVAMLEMRTRFRAVSDSRDFFGLPPGYVPFPALGEDDVNGFEIMLARAVEATELAVEDEVSAIESRRAFDGDAASFQAELFSLRTNYETSLGEICGTFIAEDGRSYPAIPRYASLDEGLAKEGDACGRAGNGSLWLAGSDLQSMELAVQRVRQELTNTLAAIDDTKESVRKQCNLGDEDVATFLETSNATQNLEQWIDRGEVSISAMDKVLDIIDESSTRIGDIPALSFAGGNSGEVFAKATALAGYGVAAAAHLITTSVLEINIAEARDDIRDIETAYTVYQLERVCDALEAELVYTLRDLHRQLALIQLDSLEAEWAVQVALSDIGALANERNRLEGEWQDAESLAVDAAAATADPNVRIYKNSAIVNADRSFEHAALAAWKATRTFEYYTASSYPERASLLLSRTAVFGENSLRRYLQDLEDAFGSFEQDFGNPDTRVARISLKRHVFKINPYTDDNVVRTTQLDAEAFRTALQNPELLDDRGGIAVRFPTTFDQLSPLTINHKVLFVEVELFGEGVGDGIARIYLRQTGTGVVSGTDRRRFYAFEPRTAVLNPQFNGDRDDLFGQDAGGIIAGPTRSIYRSYRFRERPFVQSSWELVLDQRNERVNQDIDLGGLDDIVLYVYYTDFTAQ